MIMYDSITLYTLLDSKLAILVSGAAASKEAMCKHYNELTFLCEKTANKPTPSNVNIITVPIKIVDT